MTKFKRASMVLSLTLCLSLLMGMDGVLAEAPPPDPQQQIRESIEATEIESAIGDATLCEIVPDNGDVGISDGTQVTPPDENSRTQFNAPLMFINNGTLTSDNLDDMYLFTTTEAKAPFIKIIADNPNYVAQLYQLDTATGMASPMQFYDFAGDNKSAYATSLPAYTFLWRVYSTNGTVGDPYTLMVNTTSQANFNEVMSISDDLQALTCLYGRTVITYNGKDPMPSTVAWKREVDGIGVFELQEIDDVDYGDIAGIYYGSYDSTNFRTNNALFFELQAEDGLENQQNALWEYYQTGGSVSITRMDVTGQITPRRLTLNDVYDYRYPKVDSDDTTTPTYFCLVYDIEKGEFIDFASRLNGYYFYDKANSEKIFTLDYRVIIR